MNEDVLKVFGNWQNGDAMISDHVNLIYHNFDILMSNKLEYIETLTQTDPYKALGELTLLISFINLNSLQYHPIINKLQNWISKIKDQAEKVARALFANGYSIGVGFPIGISVNLSYNVKP